MARLNTPAETRPPWPAWAGPAMLIAGAIAIGFAPIGLRLSAFEPQATGFWRFAFALPLIALVIKAQGGRIGRPSPMALLAGTFFGLDIAFWHASLVMTSVANATFLVNLGNAAVGLVAWVVLRERPARIWLVALAMALTGAFMLSRGAANAGGAALSGDLLAMVAAVMVGLYLFFAKLARRESGAMPVLFWSTATTLAVSAIACGVRGEEVRWLMFALTLYSGLTMVTNVPFYSFKDVSLKRSVPFAVIVLIALGIAVINIDPPTVMFGLFVIYGFSGYVLYGWRKAKGQQTSVISTSTDEPDERGLHK